MPAFVHGAGYEAHGQIADIRAQNPRLRATARNNQRQHMAAVYILQHTIGIYSGNKHGGVLFANALLREETVQCADGVSQRHTRGQVRIEHSLKSRSQKRGRNSLAADIGDDNGELILRADSIVKIASCFTTGKVACGQPGKRDIGNGNGHQALLDGSGDGKFLLIAARGLFGFHQMSALHHGGGFGGDGAQDVVAHRGYSAGGARVEIERSQDFTLGRINGGRRVLVARRLHLAFAQRKTNDGAQIVSDDALTLGEFHGLAVVGEKKFRVRAQSVRQNGV